MRSRLFIFLSLFLAITVVLCACSHSGRVGETMSASEDQNNSEKSDSPYEGEYKNNYLLVEYDGTVYCGDKTGLWKITSDGNKEYLYSETPVSRIAVNGKVVLFSTYDDGELIGGRYLDSHCAIQCIEVDGSNLNKLVDTIDLATPICMIGNELYYIDIKDAYSVETLAQTTWLKAYDTVTKEATPLAENAQEAVSCKNHIIYKNMGLSAESSNMLLHDYDTTSKTEHILSDVSAFDLKLFNNILYFASYKLGESGSSVSVYSYDIHAETETVQVISFDADSPMLRAYDSEKAYFQTTDFVSDKLITTNYVMDYASGAITEINDLPGDMSFNVALCGNGALFIDYDTKRAYYYDETKSYYVGKIVDEGYNFSYYDGYLFAVNDEGVILYTPWTFSENAIKPEPTEKIVDYSSYLGWWGKDYGNYAGVGVNFHSFDEDMATFDIQLSTANANRLVGTDTIEARIVDNIIEFNFHDSFDNYGSGTIHLNGDTVDLKASTDGTVNGYGLNCDAELEKGAWGGFY